MTSTVQRCWTCNEYLPFDAFQHRLSKTCHTCRDAGRAKWTKAKQRASRYRADQARELRQNKQWKESNAVHYLSQQKEYRTRRRLARQQLVLDHYGERCVCCGATERVFLTVDHVNGGGNQHRREIGRQELWEWLIFNSFPDGFEIRCYNCNIGKYRNGGVCPHERVAIAVEEPDSGVRGRTS